MSIDTFPYIPPDLLQALDRLFPEKSYTPGQTLDGLAYQGGQRSVVIFLRKAHESQMERSRESVIEVSS